MTSNIQRKKDWPEAVYKAVDDPADAGNPYIEALPHVWTTIELMEGMTRLLAFDPKHRRWSREARRVKVNQIGTSFYQPTARDLHLANDMVALIRTGYLNRNPVGPNLTATLKRGIAALADPGFAPLPNTTASGMSIIGISGIGKSTSLQIVLDCFPQVTRHVRYKDNLLPTHQIVWIKVNCPEKGSVLKLCKDLVIAVDLLLNETYARRYQLRRASLADVQIALVSIANAHGLGVLVIDEIQFLRQATDKERETLLNFFTGLMNGLGVPVVFVGTESAIPVIRDSFATARRTSAFQHHFKRMTSERTFSLFLEELWSYQYTDIPEELTSAWKSLMQFYCQGIPDIAIRLFVAVQRRALGQDGPSTLTPQLFKVVWEQRFGMMHQHINMLRTGEPVNEREWAQSLKQLHAAFDDPDEDEGEGDSVGPVVVGEALSAGPNEAVASTPCPTGKRTKRTGAALHPPTLADIVRDGATAGLDAHGAIKARGKRKS
jgi:hypothetical protein